MSSYKRHHHLEWKLIERVYLRMCCSILKCCQSLFPPPSYYLYTYDKMVAPNVSLPREAEMSPEMFGALLKHHYDRRVLGHDEPPMGQ